MNSYKPLIGLEIHVELKTKSKMFCQCSADYFGKKPNANTCPVCLGMPGALPVPNKKAVEWTIKIGQALNCTINKVSKFDRKHYFYPDLPKGYQISQYDEPIAVKGYLEVGTGRPAMAGSIQDKKKFRIHRVHLEEDTGKLLHQGDDTLIDFNRSSVPLVEIVTEADFDNADDVKAFLEELHTIIRYLDVSDADMEKGSMRLEPNISVRTKEQVEKKEFPPYKVEVKNINSFNFVKRAIEYEVKRHTELLEKGEIPRQETRGFDDKKGITYSQRSKEDAHDYRYFPEPDIPPMQFEDKYLEDIRKTIPELPAERVTRYMDLGIKQADAMILTRDIVVCSYFEQIIGKQKGKEQAIANFIINKKISTDLSIEEFIKKAEELTAPKKTDSEALNKSIETVIAHNPKVVEDYKSGKQNAIMFLVGQVMKEMKGQADATKVREELIEKLS
jgi:aspartyl-tRNA(Asn)/glutamyl-tRNA(Gln) amidotransferase subunit B